MSTHSATARSSGNLSTFAGVFTPSILTILGLVLFLRTGYVVGSAGLAGAVAIILMANVISVLTSISLSAIATNLRVRGGGDYYLISRTLGVEFGGALGVVLYLAQAVSVAFYAIGFAEIVGAIIGEQHAFALRVIAWGAIAVLFVPAWLGSDWATRFQYIVMAILFTAIGAFFLGGLMQWDPALIGDNLEPANGLAFWPLFAVFFPAVTGFTQGVSMSGDLEDPGHSLPLGTFLAVGISLLVYLAAALVFAGTIPGRELVDNPQAMRQIAPFTWLVDAGVVAACLSSGLASFLGAPRILQALAADRIFTVLTPFAKGHGDTGNPRRGVLLTLIIAAAVIGLGSLNLVAVVVTMFFLISYGLLNYATYAEAQGNSPYFRPRFKYFHAWLSLAGALACLSAMLAISPLAGGVAVAVLFTIHQYLARRSREHPERFTASDRAHRLQRIRNELHAVSGEEEHPRDWRPVVLAFSDDPGRRRRLLDFAWWLEGRAGFTTLVKLEEGGNQSGLHHAEKLENKLREEIHDSELDAFVRVISTADTRAALPVLLQAHGMGRIRVNTVLLNWFGHPGRADDAKRTAYGRNLRTALLHHCNVIMLAAEEKHFSRLDDLEAGERHIDVWYRDDATGHLMLMLAYLMTRNDPWKDAAIRLFVEQRDGRSPGKEAEKAREMLDEMRIAAEPQVVARFDAETLHGRSGESGAVFLPFHLGAGGPVSPWGGDIEPLLEGMPLTALVLAAKGVDLEADTEESAERSPRERSDGSERKDKS